MKKLYVFIGFLLCTLSRPVFGMLRLAQGARPAKMQPILSGMSAQKVKSIKLLPAAKKAQKINSIKAKSSLDYKKLLAGSLASAALLYAINQESECAAVSEDTRIIEHVLVEYKDKEKVLWDIIDCDLVESTHNIQDLPSLGRTITFDMTQENWGRFYILNTKDDSYVYVGCVNTPSPEFDAYEREEDLWKKRPHCIIIEGSTFRADDSLYEKDLKYNILDPLETLKKERNLVFSDKEMRDTVVLQAKSCGIENKYLAVYLSDRSFVARLGCAIIFGVDRNVSKEQQLAVNYHELGHIVHNDLDHEVSLEESRIRETKADSFACEQYAKNDMPFNYFHFFLHRSKGILTEKVSDAHLFTDNYKQDNLESTHPAEFKRAKLCLEALDAYLKTKNISRQSFVQDMRQKCNNEDVDQFALMLTLHFPEYLPWHLKLLCDLELSYGSIVSHLGGDVSKLSSKLQEQIAYIKTAKKGEDRFADYVVTESEGETMIEFPEHRSALRDHERYFAKEMCP